MKKEKTQEQELTVEHLEAIEAIEKRVKEKMINAFSVSCNNVNFDVIMFQDDFVRNKIILHLHFSINNKKHETVTEIDRQEILRAKNEIIETGISKILFQIFSKAISKELLTDLNSSRFIYKGLEETH